MDHKQFLHSCNLITTGLINQVMDRTFNSVGSNIFFEFGGQKEYAFPNREKSAQKEWSIWLSWTSWRITCNNKYITGSDENPEISIQSFLNEILGNRLLSFQFISGFLDIELNFENGYKINTFFNYAIENQWIIFLPNDSEIIIDCSTKESIKSIQSLAKQIRINNQFSKINISVLEEKVNQISYKEGSVSKLILSNDFLIDLGTAAWRITKNDEYYLGRLYAFTG